MKLKNAWFFNAVPLNGKDMFGSCRVMEGPAVSDVESIEVSGVVVIVKPRKFPRCVTSATNLKYGVELEEPKAEGPKKVRAADAPA